MPYWELKEQQNRSLDYVVTNSATGLSESFRILLPSDCGFGPSAAWGGSWAYSGAMAVPAAYRASTLIAGLIGAMPLHGFRALNDGPSQRIIPTPPLLFNPSPPATRVDVISAWVLDYLFHGNAIGVITSSNAEGWPTAVLPVRADQVSVRWGPNGDIEYQINGQSFDTDRVLHVRGPHGPGELRGLGVLEAALGTFTLALEQQRQAQGLAQHGVPSGLLTTNNPDVTTPDLLEAKEAWMKAQATRTVAALAPGMDFKPISWSPEELQLAEARRMSDQRIAQLFGLPLRYLQMEIGGLTYSNPTLDSLDLLKFTVDQHLERFEQEFSRHMPRGNWARFNRDAVLRADTANRYAAYQVALAAGFLTIDEVRDLEDLPPLPTGAAPAPALAPVAAPTAADQPQEVVAA